MAQPARLALSAVLLSLVAALLPAAAQAPVWYVRGDFNGWGLGDPMLDDGTAGDAVAGDGIYGAQVAIGTAGRYGFKVAYEDWSVSHPGSGNSWLQTSSDGETVTVTLDTNTVADGWLPETNDNRIRSPIQAA